MLKKCFCFVKRIKVDDAYIHPTEIKGAIFDGLITIGLYSEFSIFEVYYKEEINIFSDEIIKVSDSLSCLLESLKRYPPLIPTIGSDIMYYTKMIDYHSIEKIEYICQKLIKHYLNNQFQYPYLFQYASSSEYFPWIILDYYYWIVGYHKEEERLHYMDNYYGVSSVSMDISPFTDIEDSELEKLEGFPRKIINKGEPTLEKLILDKKQNRKINYYFVKQSYINNKDFELKNFSYNVILDLKEPCEYILIEVFEPKSKLVISDNIIKVSENIYCLIFSAKKFPVILPMIALNISYYLKELKESSIVFIEFLCKMLIKHYLDNHYKHPFSIEKVISSDYFPFSKSDFYWLIGYNKEKEILYYFDDNSIYSTNIASFDIKKDSLEKLEGYPYNIINQGEPLLEEKVLRKKSIK